MKRTSIFYFSLAAIATGSLASCQDYEPFDEEVVRETAAKKQYAEEFIKAFGEINPNHNWGFEPQIIGGSQLSETRGSNTNSNEWITVYNYEVPGGLSSPSEGINAPWRWAKGDVTNYERAYVYWWFSTHQWPKTEIINWSDYFIENVWGQPEHTGLLADASQFDGAVFGMDHMTVMYPGNTPDFYASNYDATNAMSHKVSHESYTAKYEEINNFNKAGDNLEQVMYQFNTTTLDFTYGASRNSSEPHNNWTIQCINGNYYLAFDYWHDKGNNDDYAHVNADGYYNDWILKLSNGKHDPTTGQTRRVMCEDLGNSFDWDYNDVVFDVTAFVEGGNYYAQITLQAAGGTLPIYVGDMQHEAHAMFGVPVTQPVNVDNTCKRPAVVYRVSINQSDCVVKRVLDPVRNEYVDALTFNALKIPVYVKRNGNNEAATSLVAEPGTAPHKISCPSDTYWMQELEDIRQDEGHPNIAKWFKGQDKDGNTLPADQLGSYADWRSTTLVGHGKLYADKGEPYSSSYHPGEDPNNNWSSSSFVAWKTLWDALFDGSGNYIGDAQFTATRTIDVSYNSQSQQWSTQEYTFMEQAPYIYHSAKSNDPIAYSTRIFKDAETYLANQGDALTRVWPAVQSYTLTLNVNDSNMGSVVGAGTYTNGTDVTIEANPVSDSYVFVQWSDGNKNAHRTVKIQGDDMTLTATFAVNPYTQLVETITSVSVGTDLTSYLRGKHACMLKITGKNYSNSLQLQINSERNAQNNWNPYVQLPISDGVESVHIVTNIGDLLKVDQGGNNVAEIKIYINPTES